MGMVNIRTYFFPRMYLFKVIELRENASKGSGGEREGRKKGDCSEGHQANNEDYAPEEESRWSCRVESGQKDVEWGYARLSEGHTLLSIACGNRHDYILYLLLLDVV